MLRSYILFFLCIVLVGCATRQEFIIRTDPFSREKIATIDLKHTASQGSIESSVLQYERTVSGKGPSSLSVLFIISFAKKNNYTSMRLIDEIVQIRIGEKFYDIKANDQRVEEKQTCGGFIISACTTKYTLKEKAIFTKEMEKEILKAGTLKYRLSTYEPVVLEVDPKQLVKIKELLNLTPSKLE